MGTGGWRRRWRLANVILMGLREEGVAFYCLLLLMLGWRVASVYDMGASAPCVVSSG